MQPKEPNHPGNEGIDSSHRYESDSQPLFAPIEALIGSNIDQYYVEREIGRGSMGVVFEAFNRDTHERVALKVLPPNINLSDKVIKRFLREAESVARLDHPNIVKIFGIGHKDSIYYYAMELIDGQPLDEVLKANPLLPFKRIARLIMQACEAVDFAHSQNIIHRDIKPGNIIVGDGDKVVITDFGLARQEKAATLTESGALVGTPIYMSPEQVMGRRGGVDKRTDIYSMGVTLYQLISGDPPFTSESTQKILSQIMDEEPEPPLRKQLKVPRALSIITLKAMEKDPRHRFQTAGEMAEDLGRFLRGSSIKSKPAGFITRNIKRVKRHKVISTLASVIIILALAFLTNVILSKEKMKESQEKSEQAQEDIRIESQERNYKYYDNIRLAKDYLEQPRGLAANLDTTLALLNEAVSLFPERPEAHLNLGKTYALMGDGRRALEKFTTAVEYGPNSCDVYLARALFLLEQGRQLELDMAIDLGFSDLRKALTLDNENASVAYHMAKTLYDGSMAIDLKFEERRRMASMAHNFAKQAQTLGSTADVECLLAQTFLEFIKYSTSDIERTTNLDSAHKHLLKSLEMDKNHELANALLPELEKMRETRDLAPGDTGTWEFLTGTGLTHAKRISDMVISGFEKTWSETEKTDLLNNVMTFLISPETSPGEPIDNSAQTTDGDALLSLDYPALLEKAKEHEAKAEWPAVIRCYERALVLNPTKAHELNFKIARALFNQKELGLALQHARLAYSQDPENIEYLGLLGKILLALEDHAGFEILYNEAKEKGRLSLLGWQLPGMKDEEAREKKPKKKPSNMLELRFP